MNKIKDSDIKNGYSEDANGWYEDEDSNKYHFVDGYIHSVNDEPSIFYAIGHKAWHNQGKFHSDNDMVNVKKVEPRNNGSEWLIT